jgi:hypothetical protein
MRDNDEEREDLPPTEAARDRRRDRHASASERAGMRTGLAKQFKQVLDAQVKRASDARRASEGDPETVRDSEAADRHRADRAAAPDRHRPAKGTPPDR